MDKKRISLTLRKDILRKIDKRIDGVRIRNRSHAIELLLSQILEEQKIRQAFLLVGGEGTRLRPLTYEIPKALIPVKGKPILEHLIKHLKNYGVDEFLLAVGHLSERVISYFGNGEKWGVDIQYIIEKKKMGTAGSLKLTEDRLRNDFLMLNGDVLSKIDIADFTNFHREKNGLATIALVAVENPSHYGVVDIRGDQVIAFAEKPKEPPSNLISAGVYLLEKAVLDYIPNGYSMIEKDVFPQLAKEGKLFGYVYSGPWYDVGTPSRLEEAIKNWKP